MERKRSRGKLIQQAGIPKEKNSTNHNASYHERHVQHHCFLHVGIVFRREHMGTTDFAAATDLGTKLSQMSLLFIFREEPRGALNKEKQKTEERKRKRW
jgi:hypothetical protein